MKHLESWQLDNIERACNEAVREALFYGLDAMELKQMLAASWLSVLREKAELGERAILS
jgi:hypothetical protein